MPKIMTQSRVQHQQVVEEVEVPIPMQQEEVIHVPKIQTATRQVQQHVEQVVEVPIHQKREEVVHVPKVVTHTRTSHQHVEQTVEAPGLTTKRLETIRNPPEIKAFAELLACGAGAGTDDPRGARARAQDHDPDQHFGSDFEVFHAFFQRFSQWSHRFRGDMVGPRPANSGQVHQQVVQDVEVPVPMMEEVMVHVPKIMTQTRVRQENAS